jgi:hypothetical protein
VQSGNTIICLPCDITTNSVGIRNLTTCVCPNNELVWNPSTRRCDCGQNGIFFRGTCINCDESRFSTGAAPANGTAAPSCRCRFTSMTWNAQLGTCVCTLETQIIFIAPNATCQLCGSITNSLTGRRVTPFSCACPTGFTWRINAGCLCHGQNAALVSFNGISNFICITCDFSIYSSGASADGRRCVCLGSLTWLAAGRRCGCPIGSVIAVDNGVYSCVVCNATIYTATLTA